MYSGLTFATDMVAFSITIVLEMQYCTICVCKIQ